MKKNTEVPGDGPKKRSAFCDDPVSELKRVKEELALFKTIVEETSEAVAVSDPRGGIVYINRAHAKLFGRSLEQARKSNYREYYPPESIAILNEEVAPALEKGLTWEALLRRMMRPAAVFSYGSARIRFGMKTGRCYTDSGLCMT